MPGEMIHETTFFTKSDCLKWTLDIPWQFGFQNISDFLPYMYLETVIIRRVESCGINP